MGGTWQSQPRAKGNHPRAILLPQLVDNRSVGESTETSNNLRNIQEHLRRLHLRLIR